MEDYHCAFEPDFDADDPPFTVGPARKLGSGRRTGQASGTGAGRKQGQAVGATQGGARDDAGATGVPGYGMRLKVRTFMQPLCNRASSFPPAPHHYIQCIPSLLCTLFSCVQNYKYFPHGWVNILGCSIRHRVENLCKVYPRSGSESLRIHLLCVLGAANLGALVSPPQQ